MVGKLLPKFDPTINVGHLAIICSWLIGLFTAYTDVVRKTDNYEYRITTLEQRTGDMHKVQIDIYDLLNALRQDVAILKSRGDRPGDRSP